MPVTFGLSGPWREALLESSLDCVIIMDAAGRIVDFNRGTARTFGVTPEQTIGRLLGDVFVPPELRAAHHAGLARYLATGESKLLDTRIEVSAMHASGRHIPVELSIVRLGGTDPPLFVGHLRTIEARLRSERRLQVSAAIHAVLANANDSETAVRNTVTALGTALGWLTVQFWSVTEDRTALQLRAWWDRTPNATDLSAFRAYRTLAAGVGLPGTVLVSGQADWLEDITVAVNFPRHAAAISAGVRTAIALPIDVHGRTIGVIEAFSTIEEDRDEELLRLLSSLGSQLGHLIEDTVMRAALARTEARYRQVLESIQDAFTVLDDDYRYVYVNERAAQWARRPAAEMIGQLLWEVYPSIRDTPIFEAIGRSRIEGRPVTVEALHVDLERWIEARIYPHPEGTAVFVTDISARRRAEAERAELLAREQEANRLKNEFLAVISHELRTPLSPIIGWTRMLLEKQVPEHQMQTALQSIERNALLESHLVEDLLDVSRIMAGKLTIVPLPTDAAASVRAAIDTVRGAAADKQLQLSLEGPPSLPLVLADPRRLQQILSNVLSNAIKFTPDGGRIAVSMSTAGTDIEVVVRDSGMGISAAFLPHVFDRFRQEDSRTTRQSGGLGLGLSIVRDLLTAHGGSIAVTSDGEDRGTTVTIRLPVHQMSPTVNPSGNGS